MENPHCNSVAYVNGIPILLTPTRPGKKQKRPGGANPLQRVINHAVAAGPLTEAEVFRHCQPFHQTSRKTAIKTLKLLFLYVDNKTHI